MNTSVVQLFNVLRDRREVANKEIIKEKRAKRMRLAQPMAPMQPAPKKADDLKLSKAEEMADFL